MQSVQTAFRVLETVAQRQPCGVSALARELEMSKSTAQRFLRALEAAGWLRQRDASLGSGWVMTARPTIFAQYVAADLNLRDVALPVMTRIRERHGEAVHLALQERTEIVIIELLESSHSVRIHWPVGQHSPTYATANGKAVLACVNDEQREAMLPRTFERFTERTIADRSELSVELEKVRRDGYATSRGELRDDIASVAAAILLPGSGPVASLSIFLPMHRLADHDIPDLGESVVQATEEVSSGIRGPVMSSLSLDPPPESARVGRGVRS